MSTIRKTGQMTFEIFDGIEAEHVDKAVLMFEELEATAQNTHIQMLVQDDTYTIRVKQEGGKVTEDDIEGLHHLVGMFSEHVFDDEPVVIELCDANFNTVHTS